MKTATIQVLQGENKFVVTEFDEECIGMEEVASPLISNKEYSKRTKLDRKQKNLRWFISGGCSGYIIE